MDSRCNYRPEFFVWLYMVPARKKPRIESDVLKPSGPLDSGDNSDPRSRVRNRYDRLDADFFRSIEKTLFRVGGSGCTT